MVSAVRRVHFSSTWVDVWALRASEVVTLSCLASWGFGENIFVRSCVKCGARVCLRGNCTKIKMVSFLVTTANLDKNDVHLNSKKNCHSITPQVPNFPQPMQWPSLPISALFIWVFATVVDWHQLQCLEYGYIFFVASKQ